MERGGGFGRKNTERVLYNLEASRFLGKGGGSTSRKGTVTGGGLERGEEGDLKGVFNWKKPFSREKRGESSRPLGGSGL